MKKILVSLLVLALCTPAMAATVTINDNGDGTGTIVVDAGEPNAIVGLALNINATGGNITAVSIDGTANPTFNIYPDAAHDLEEAEEGSYTYGAGTPIADQEAAGEVAVSNNFAISVGSLNGEETPGADGASTVTINIEVDADTNICVEENALRGGIVLAGGDGVDIDGEIVCDDITASCKGDINNGGVGDGKVSALDISELIVYLTPYAPLYEVTPIPSGDEYLNLNGDTKISALDISALIVYLTPYAPLYETTICMP